MQTLSAASLKRHVYRLAGEIGEHNVFHPEALKAAERYITGAWQEQGYEVVPQIYTTHGIDCANLEITRQGTNPQSGIILIGAHYDSVFGSPGANDNGSGVAAMLELSRLFRTVQPKTTLRFVAFVNEEPPFYYWSSMGSMIYAKQAKRRGDNIRFMISLETLGFYSDTPGSQHYPPLLKYFYPDRGNFIAFVSNLRSRGVMLENVEAFRAGSDFPVEHIATLACVPGVAWSDHLSFWRRGYPAFMITDTALFRYPYYHCAEDTPDKLNYAAFAAMTNGLAAMLMAMTER